MKLSHVASDGSVAMVEVSGKSVTSRFARAQALVRMNAAAQTAIRDATLAKGDALVAAQIAGILAAKQTSALIPLAHPLPLTSVDVRFDWRADGVLRNRGRRAHRRADRRRNGGDGCGERLRR